MAQIVGTIGFGGGYQRASAFFAAFLRHVGMTPSECRNDGFLRLGDPAGRAPC